MGMTATLDRMVHSKAIHHELGIEIGLGDCSAPGGSGGDLSPIDVMAMSIATCLMLVMGKGARTKGIDLTGTWADIAYDLDLKDYIIRSVSVTIHSSQTPLDIDRAFLEKESHKCPVYLAVKDNVKVNVAFEWGSNTVPTSKSRTQPQSTHSGSCGATHKP